MVVLRFFKRREIFCFGLAFFLSFLTIFPLISPDFYSGLDWNGMRFAHEAFLRRAVFGKEIIFNYGPWGFLALAIWNPGTFFLFTCLWAFLCGAWAATTWALWKPLRERSLIYWLLAFAGASLLVGSHDPRFTLPPDAFFFSLLFACVLLAEKRIRQKLEDPLLALTFLPVAFLALVKFTYFAFALGAWGWLLACSVFRWKRFPFLLLAIFPALYLLFWGLAHQSLANLPAYFSTSWEVARGYGDAMSLQGNPLTPRIFFLGSLGILWLLAQAKPKITEAFLWVFYFWFLLKAGFVRQDEHQMIAFSAWAPAFVTAWVADQGLFLPRKRIWKIALAGFLLVGFFVGTKEALNQSAGDWFSFRLAKAEAISRAILEPRAYQEELERGAKKSLAEIDALLPAPTVPGTVDSYFNQLAPALREGSQYRPRPNFLSNASYTGPLLEANARYLEFSGPEFLFWHLDSIDERYLTLEESLSWIPLLSLYSPYAQLKKAVLVKRSALPRVAKMAQATEQKLNLGAEFYVPKEYEKKRLLWARISLRKTWWGKTLGFLFKVDPLLLNITDEKGQSFSFRLLVENAEAGFLLSPRVHTLGDVWELSLSTQENRPPALPRIRSFSVEANPMEWKEEVKVELSAVSVR